jgi:hypothetical protein
VINLTNQTPPYIRAAEFFFEGFDQNVHDIRGRYFYARVALDF